MSNKKKILLLINWKNRDLRCIVQTGTVLENKGYEVRYTNHRNAIWNIFNFKPDLVVFPQVIAEKDKANLSRKIGARICVIRSEGIVTPKSINIVFKFDPTVDINSLTDLYIVWGHGMKDLFEIHSNVEQSKIKICGNPRFDIYRKPLSVLLDNELIQEKTSLSKDKKIILFASNFVYLDKEKKMGRKNIGEDYDEYIAIQQRFYEKCMSNLKKFFSENPDIQLLLKPHPLELKNKYSELLVMDNVDFIEDIDTSLILDNIDIMLHTNSTMSTEACMLSKPVITLFFEEREDELLPENIKDLPQVRNFDELQACISQYIESGKMEDKFVKKQNEFIEKWFYKVDGQSTLRCGEEIDSFMKNNKIVIEKKPLKLNDYFQIFLSSPLGVKMISILSRIKHFGKKTYYHKVEEKENCTKKQIEDMRNIAKQIYEESKYMY